MDYYVISSNKRSSLVQSSPILASITIIIDVDICMDYYVISSNKSLSLAKRKAFVRYIYLTPRGLKACLCWLINIIHQQKQPNVQHQV